MLKAEFVQVWAWPENPQKTEIRSMCNAVLEKLQYSDLFVSISLNSDGLQDSQGDQRCSVLRVPERIDFSVFADG